MAIQLARKTLRLGSGPMGAGLFVWTLWIGVFDPADLDAGLERGQSLVGLASVAHAYPVGPLFSSDAAHGGGGGRFFTGAFGDAYTCGVCHVPVETFQFSVVGLPAQVVAGRSYDFRVDFGRGQDAYDYAIAAEIAASNGATVGVVTGHGPDIESIADPRRSDRIITFARKKAVRKSIHLRWQLPVDYRGAAWVFLAGVGGDASSTTKGDSVGTLRMKVDVLPATNPAFQKATTPSS